MKKVFTLFLLVIFSYSCFAQSTGSGFITVDGEVTKPLKLTMKDLEKYPLREVTAKDREGREHVYRGTALFTILDSAGVTLRQNLRGKNLAKYVLITATDNYRVIYALPELDPDFTSNTVLLATHVDGKLLPKGEGPFRLVNPADKKPTRWIREIKSIKILVSLE